MQAGPVPLPAGRVLQREVVLWQALISQLNLRVSLSSVPQNNKACTVGNDGEQNSLINYNLPCVCCGWVCRGGGARPVPWLCSPWEAARGERLQQEARSPLLLPVTHGCPGAATSSLGRRPWGSAAVLGRHLAQQRRWCASRCAVVMRRGGAPGFFQFGTLWAAFG